jgi:hypothetical protein
MSIYPIFNPSAFVGDIGVSLEYLQLYYYDKTQVNNLLNGFATTGNNNIFTANNTFNGHLNVNHIVGNSATPNITIGAGITVSSVLIIGTDISGKITLNGVSGGVPNGIICTITYNTVYQISPRAVLISPANSTARSSFSSTEAPYVLDTDISTTIWKITQGTAKLSNGTYILYYMVL